ncbi:helix-turn-helix transcriptional regulator [Desulfomarina sp.]
MSLLERVFYFHREVVKGNFPNSKSLSAQFETSPATSKRDIAYLRDRLLAPLVFDRKKNGYRYGDESFALPFENGPRIVFLLTMLNRFAGEAGLAELPEVQQLEKKLSSMVLPDYRKLLEKISCEWIEVETVDHHVFAAISEGLTREKFLNISYRALDKKSSTRKIAPLLIHNYQGRWYLLAYCNLRKANRLFHMARISTVEITDSPTPSETTIDRQSLQQSFGIFKGSPRCIAEILFTGTAAELVRNQHWHRDQEMQQTDNGLLLRLPISDFREITMKILQYGRLAKVVSPPELQEKIISEINGMAEIYMAGSQGSLTK